LQNKNSRRTEMKNRITIFFSIIQMVWILTACDFDYPDVSEACNIQPGELIITEILSSKTVGAEWLELQNISRKNLILNRLYITIQGAGSPKSETLFTDKQLGANEYVVVSDRPGGFSDISLDSFNLASDSGRVQIECLGKIIDTVEYGTEKNPIEPEIDIAIKAELLFDGQNKLVSRRWCHASEATENGQLGSPGKNNSLCGLMLCLDEGQARKIRHAKQGDLFISEIFNNPQGSDIDKEWLELKIVNGGIDLNGIEIQINSKQWKILQQECITTEANSFVSINVYSSVDQFKQNEKQLKMKGDGIPGSVESIKLAVQDQVIESIDVTLNAKEGASLSRDWNGSQQWCHSRSVFIEGDAYTELSTKGSENDPCGAACLSNGRWRLIEVAQPHMLRFDSALPNPAGADKNQEWVLVQNISNIEFDLNDSLLKNTSDSSGKSKELSITQDACLSLSPGDFLLIAGNDVQPSISDKTYNSSKLSLYNDASQLQLFANEQLLAETQMDAASEDTPVVFK